VFGKKVMKLAEYDLHAHELVREVEEDSPGSDDSFFYLSGPGRVVVTW